MPGGPWSIRTCGLYIGPACRPMKHIPNALSASRILMVPLFLALLFSGGFGARLGALVVFVIAALSDWLDGRVARRYEVKSRLGMFLDPLADKVLVLGAFIALAVLLPDLVPWWAVALITVRDVAITGLRVWAEHREAPLRTVPLAKTKTGVQLTFVILTLILWALMKLPGVPLARSIASDLLHGPILFAFLIFVVLLTTYTGIVYFVRRETVST